MNNRTNSRFLPHFLATLLAATMLVAPMPAQAATMECQVTSAADSGANTLRSCLGAFVSTNSDLRITFTGPSIIELDSPIAITTNFGGSPTLSLEINGPIQIKPSASFTGTDALIDITTAEVMNVVFNGVTMTDATTGALDVSSSAAGGSLTLESSNFFRNTVAGAVTSNLAVTVVGGLFQGNASTDGGAIYGQKIVSITDATFRSNTATGDGGAIWTGPGQTLTVTNSYFDSNTAVSDGGGIYAEADSQDGNDDIVQVSVSRSTFVVNQAEDDEGGAIYAEEDISIDLSEFERNTAYLDGGAVHSLDGDISVSNSRFEANVSETEDGGALWADEYVHVGESSFIANTAFDARGEGSDTAEGGAIRSSTGDVTVSSSHFEANKAEDGGAIHAADSVAANLSSFVSNTAGDDGGAMYGDEEAFAGFSTFSGNTAEDEGGAVWAEDNFHSAFNTFVNNRADYASVAYMDDEDWVSVGTLYASESGSQDMIDYEDAGRDFGGNVFTSSENVVDQDNSIVKVEFLSLELSPLTRFSNGTFGFTWSSDSILNSRVSQANVDAFNDDESFDFWDLSLSSDQAGNVPQAPFSTGSVDFAGSVAYFGPTVINDPETAQSGSTVTYTGSNLDDVTSATIAGQSAAIVSKSASSLTLRVPAGLEQGMHDVVLHYSTTESLTLQNGLVVQDLMKVWTQLQSDNTVKMYAKNIIGEGKIQFFHNNNEIAWVRASNALNPKLRQANGSSYLVRTRELVAGKNAFEIYDDGKRIWRAAYSK